LLPVSTRPESSDASVSSTRADRALATGVTIAAYKLLGNTAVAVLTKPLG
jgi:hypothetical protein